MAKKPFNDYFVTYTSPLWTCMFKDDSWLQYAKTFDKTVDINGHQHRYYCNPLLIGNNLRSFRPGESKEGLYFILLAGDYSGDLRYDKEGIFFASLHDDREYDEETQEIKFKSGLTVNVSEVMTGTEKVWLPVSKLFPEGKDFKLEYIFLNDDSPTIRTLEPPNIIGIGGPAKTGEDVRYGCALHFPYQGGVIEWIVIDKDTEKQLNLGELSTGPGVDMRSKCELTMSMQFRDPEL